MTSFRYLLKEYELGPGTYSLAASIAIGLGNTRTRAAVPPLIAMFGNNPTQAGVCNGLRTLTHREWCDGTAGDPAAKRRRWLRWWNENGSSAAIERADRIDVEFRQGDVAVINQATGQYPVHVEVPAAIGAGQVWVRTRTWIEQTASEWSAPARFEVRARPVPPSVRSIHAGPARSLVWWSGANPPTFARVQPGEALVLHGLFPVARVVDLRIQLRGTRETYDLSPTEVIGGVQVEIPPQTSPGDWRLVIDTTDRRTPPQDVITLRVN